EEPGAGTASHPIRCTAGSHAGRAGVAHGRGAQIHPRRPMRRRGSARTTGPRCRV
ncbi:MAG: hypothetical protein AVDCRST_MAG26-3952, partial [uncultured Chloroflexia bacterium]